MKIETGDPVETGEANTDYAPAFPEQTRIGSVATTTAYATSIVTSSLSSPWGIAAMPDGRLLITEKGGTMRIVSASGEVGKAISGVPAVNAAGQGGLLGVCLDPQFETNRMVYWAFSQAISGGNVTAVAKGALSAEESKLENVAVIYQALPAHPSTLHYGGRVIFDDTGNLLVSTGERSSLDSRPLAQSTTAALGKIIRVNTSGQAAAGNPVFSGGLPELYSIGHRNPQGIAIHPVTHALYQSEHGPRGGDEINLVEPGKNYGWPTITYGIEYNGSPVGGAIQHQEGLEQPVYYWDPVVSPSGITFYKGNRIPEWENNLFIGALSGEHIVRLVIDGDRVLGEERLLANQGQRFRAITQDGDGALYAITDQGRLYKIDRQ